MGIRGLANVLRQFASREELRGRVVIDGPALAYYILGIARLNVLTIIDEPSYPLLATTVTQWLDSLQSHGLEVSVIAMTPGMLAYQTLIIDRAAIYFDGSLPSSKKEERHKRICEKSHAAQKYFLTTILGVNTHSRVPKNLIPNPPFHVPAILEALSLHQKYRHITHVVPGEADPYCAADVKQNGGMLFTSDSDLLLYDLGSTGSVIFFKDVQLDLGVTEPSGSISALTWKPHELCRRLSLEPSQMSMLQVGFGVKLKPCHSPRGLPNRSSWASIKQDNAEEFAAFVAEYDGSADHTAIALNCIGHLDPRVSEFVLDWAKGDTSGGDSESTKDLTVWLPLLVDRWDQASAWDLSTTIRQLAYSCCQRGESSKSTVKEYRRTLSLQSAGQAVELLDESEILEATRGLLEHVDHFVVNGSTVPRKLQWITMCLSVEIGHAAQEGKHSNALYLWRKAAMSQGRLDPGSWDTLHLTAQILGTLYSFRMLQQVISTIQAGGPMSRAASSDQLERLRERLSSLPPIAEFPAMAEMKDIFGQLQQEGQLEILSEAVGVSPIIFTAKGETLPKSRNKQQKAKGPEKKPRKATASQLQARANPFAALSADD